MAVTANGTYVHPDLQVDNAAPDLNVLKAPGSPARGTLAFDTQALDFVDSTTELLVNGKRVAVRTISGNNDAILRLAWSSAGQNGKFTLTLRSKDWFGQSRQVVRTVTVDNKAPALSITAAPKNKATVKGKVTIKATATDTNKISRVELLVNGKVVAKDTTAGYAFTLNTAKQQKTMKIQPAPRLRQGGQRQVHDRPHLAPQVASSEKGASRSRGAPFSPEICQPPALA